MSRALWACAILWCCLIARAPAAGIQLLDSDPRLTGAIWYPCAGEVRDIPLGPLAVSPEIKLAGVRDCPVTGAKLPLIVIIDENMTGIYAVAGYNVGTADMILKLLNMQK